jgi:hypothetical protein
VGGANGTTSDPLKTAIAAAEDHQLTQSELAALSASYSPQQLTALANAITGPHVKAAEVVEMRDAGWSAKEIDAIHEGMHDVDPDSESAQIGATRSLDDCLQQALNSVKDHALKAKEAQRLLAHGYSRDQVAALKSAIAEEHMMAGSVLSLHEAGWSTTAIDDLHQALHPAGMHSNHDMASMPGMHH